MNLLKNKNKKYIKITIRTLSFQTYFILLEEASGIWYTYPQQLTVLIATNSLENNLALYIQNDKNFDTVIPLLEIWCNKAKINQKQQYLWQEERKEERRVEWRAWGEVEGHQPGRFLYSHWSMKSNYQLNGRVEKKGKGKSKKEEKEWEDEYQFWDQGLIYLNKKNFLSYAAFRLR